MGIDLGTLSSLLDKIPFWKELKALPKRVDKLEKELKSLKKQNGKPCPECRKNGVILHPETIYHPNPEKRYRIWSCSFCKHEIKQYKENNGKYDPDFFN